MEQFSGIYTAVPTPFHEDGTLNEKALETLIERNIKEGVSGFYLSGSTGESYMMTNEQRKHLIRAAAQIVGRRKAVIANIGSFSLDQALDMALYARDQQITAISSVPPFYFPFNKREIRNYYLNLQKKTGMPVIIYNVPDLSGVRFTTGELLELLSWEGIAGVKQTTKDLFQTELLVRKNPGKCIFNGHDEIFLPALSVGVQATIGSTVAIMADQFLEVEQAFKAGRMKEALKAQGKINDMVESLLKVGIFKGIKAVLALQGIDCGVCRQPFERLTGDEMKVVEEALARL